MKDPVLYTYPPIYPQLVEAFGDLSKYKPVFAYSPYIYNPFNRNITPDILHHEFIHIGQQKTYTSPDVWYDLYIHDDNFRLNCELEAYGEQFLFAKQHGVSGQLLDWLKDKLALEISGEAYGGIISYGEAVSKIRNYAKRRGGR